MYTIITYRTDKVVRHKSFTDIRKAFKQLGKAALNTKIERCILDNGINILFDLKRGEDGWLSS